MKEMSLEKQIQTNAGGGYRCSGCGAKFYTYVIHRTPWWMPDVKSRAIDQCNTHIITAHRGHASARWCW